MKTMSRLPPYSTFRTDKMQPMYPQAVSHGNVLSFTPPGFKQCLNVKFPDSRLAVCAKCKKNYKTRDSCRVRSGHTSPPWTTAYICITLDQSCTTPEGKYIDAPLTIRMVQWQPYSVKTDFDVKTPVCAACKKTNRTRSFCRARHMHRQLPWCTVFVLLSAVDSTDPSTVVAAPSRPVVPEEQGNEEKESNEEDNNVKEESDTTKPVDPEATTTDVYDTKTIDSKTPVKVENPENGQSSNDNHESDKLSSPDNDKAAQQPEPNLEGDDINEIDPSRTFLVKVSTKSISIHWLELGGEAYTNTDSDVKALNDAIRSPTIQMPPLLDSSRYYAQMGGNFAFPFQQAQMYPMWGAQPAQYGQQIMQWCGGQMPQQAGQMTPGMAPAAIPVGAQMLAPTSTSTLAPNQKDDVEDGGEVSEIKTNEGDKSIVNIPAPAPLQAQANGSPQDMWQAQVMLQQQMILAHQQQLMGQMMSNKANEKGEIGVNDNGSSPEDGDDPLKKRQRI